MPSEIHEIYSMIVQLKAQNSKLVADVIALKQNWWQKNYGSVIAIVSIVGSFFIAYFSQRWLYKNQSRLEEEKREKEKIKIRQDNFKRIYSELSSTLMAFINKSIMQDFEKIQFFYFSDLSNVYNRFMIDREKALSSYVMVNTTIKGTDPYEIVVEEHKKMISDYNYCVNEYKIKGEMCHDKMLKHMSIVSDCFNKINELTFEYDYLKSNSEVIDLVKKFTDNLNGYIKSDLFNEESKKCLVSLNIDKNEFMLVRDNAINYSAKQHESDLHPLILQIQSKIKQETKVENV